MVDNGTQVARLLAQWQQSIIHALPDIASAVLILLLFTVLAWLFRRASLRFYNRVFPATRVPAKSSAWWPMDFSCCRVFFWR